MKGRDPFAAVHSALAWLQGRLSPEDGWAADVIFFAMATVEAMKEDNHPWRDNCTGEVAAQALWEALKHENRDKRVAAIWQTSWYQQQLGKRIKKEKDGDRVQRGI